MALVGDVILAARELFPDYCQSLQPPPVVPSGGFSSAASGAFLANSTVWWKVTQGNQFGETAPVQEFTTTTNVNFQVVLTVTTSFQSTYIRVYFTQAGAGNEDQYYEYTIPTPTNSIIVSFISNSATITSPPATLTVNQGVPPIISRAWLPDSDGNILSAMRIYQWLKEGGETMGQLTGGIRDVLGIPSTFGQAQYQVINRWQKIDNNFYDGYPIAGGHKQQVFRHNSVTGLSGVVTVNVSSDREFIELWPQSQRTAGTAFITAPIATTDTSFAISNLTGWVLPLGLLLVGTYPPTVSFGPGSCELMYYSALSSNSIGQLSRGMGGTQPQNWPIGTIAHECNIFLTGKRDLQIYKRGQSTFQFSAPSGFADALRTYLIYRFKQAEQDTQGAAEEKKSFEKMCSDLSSSSQLDGPRQVQIGGTGGVEIAVGLGSPFGGVIIP